MNASPRSRPAAASLGVIVAVLLIALLAGCSSSTPSAMSTGGASPSSPPSSASPAEAPVPAEGARVATQGRWDTVGQIGLALEEPQAVLLDDGRVLVAGYERDLTGIVGTTPVSVVIWDPTTRSWTPAPGLPKPRIEFAMVKLHDGRVMVIGGANEGVEQDGGIVDRASYSSTYVFDPRRPEAGWTRAGLLNTARTAPAAAVLPDGRVLVAGGYYLSGRLGRAEQDGGAVLAASRQGTGDPSVINASWLADVGPEVTIPALATAELYDPATGTWSKTGSMRYPRFGSAAATLTDGRVLVVGAVHERDVPMTGPSAGAYSPVDARSTAEIFDPATGRFSPAGRFPDPDESALSAPDLGERAWPDDLLPTAVGTLVGLPDGGALLVGWTAYAKHVGSLTRVLRFVAGHDQWVDVGRTYGMFWESAEPGFAPRYGATAAPLRDGRVLVGGGDLPAEVGGIYGRYTRSVELFDPVTDTWTDGPPLPLGRAGGVAVSLLDGSVLVVGGCERTARAGEPNCSPQILRFVPEP